MLFENFGTHTGFHNLSRKRDSNGRLIKKAVKKDE
jgi:hypothetical protein